VPVPPRPKEKGGEMAERLARQVAVLPEVMGRIDGGLGPLAPAGIQGAAPLGLAV